MSKQLIVPGHYLVWEGAPHYANGQRKNSYYYAGVGGTGRAKCSCGELSESLPSARQRKQWHRDHKNQILGDQVLEEIREVGGLDEWRAKQREVTGR